MNKFHELKSYNIEKNYWWFIVRRDIIFKLIQKMNKNSKILEIGCSARSLIEFLERKRFNNIYGIDISKDGIDISKEKGIKNVFVMDGKKTKFNDNEFDIIIASDVLEHIKEDDLALVEWNRIMKPSGKLIVFVPTFNFLWGTSDEINHHYRRYSKLQLINILKRTNFKINKSSYWNFFLFFPVSLIRILGHLFSKIKHDELYEVNHILNKILINLLKFENWFVTKLSFPIGISVFAVGTKRD